MDTRHVLLALSLLTFTGCPDQSGVDDPGGGDPQDDDPGDATLPPGPFGLPPAWCEGRPDDETGGVFSLVVTGDGPWEGEAWELDWDHYGPPDDSPGSDLEMRGGAYRLRTSEGPIESDEIADNVWFRLSLLPDEDDFVRLSLIHVNGAFDGVDGYDDDTSPPAEGVLEFEALELDSSCTVTIGANPLVGSLSCASAAGTLDGEPGAWAIELSWEFECAWMQY